nr:GNAT family [Colletotrichum truncatum]KAF6780894.1 GNAT family [Colletotrichum truncatum]
MSIRPATKSDLDAITWIAVAALPADPVCTYRFPYREQYPEDHTKYTRIRNEEYMMSGENAFFVYECPSIEDPTVTKPVAYSIWQLPPSEVQPPETSTNAGPPTDHLQRKDAAPERMKAYRAAMSKAKAQWFDEKYGDQQLYLSMLACHPSYQRRGAGELLCQWGFEKAEKQNLTLTLLGSPMGTRLYNRLGFTEVAKFRTQVDGEEEYFDTSVMVLERT